MATSISAILVPCLKCFNLLQERVEQPDYSYEEDVSSVSWGDELGRLRVWAANIGAHQTGQSSLEFRLRDASHIRQQITKLLRDLVQVVNDIIDELSDDGTKAIEDDKTPADWPDNDSTTELQQLHEEVVTIIDCLYQLSMLIRKPAKHDLFVGSRMSDKAEFETYDKWHVRSRHPRAEEQISQRMGRAITRRRKYLCYRERHHRKLEKGIEEVQGIQRATTESVMLETIATDFKTQGINFEETSSNTDMSQSSYASLLDGGRVTVSSPPKAFAEGKPFECPYCFFVIEIKSMRSWIRHIFKDIKPYVCALTECSMPDRLYDSRREWHFHETTEHHREDFLCALCKDSLKSARQYERHVGRHLEELALFALPRVEMDSDEDDQNESGYLHEYHRSESHASVHSESSLGEDDADDDQFALPGVEMDSDEDDQNEGGYSHEYHRSESHASVRSESSSGEDDTDTISTIEWSHAHASAHLLPFDSLSLVGEDEGKHHPNASVSPHEIHAPLGDPGIPAYSNPQNPHSNTSGYGQPESSRWHEPNPQREIVGRDTDMLEEHSLQLEETTFREKGMKRGNEHLLWLCSHCQHTNNAAYCPQKCGNCEHIKCNSCTNDMR